MPGVGPLTRHLSHSQRLQCRHRTATLLVLARNLFGFGMNVSHIIGLRQIRSQIDRTLLNVEPLRRLPIDILVSGAFNVLHADPASGVRVAHLTVGHAECTHVLSVCAWSDSSATVLQ